MRIQVVNTEQSTGSGKNGRPYNMVTVKYLSNGKQYDKKLTQFSDAYKAFVNAEEGQQFSVDLVKDGAFTEWKNVQALDDEAPVTVAEEPKKGPGRPKGSTSAPKTEFKSTYETPEERKARQELIVRQSSITNAIEYYKARAGLDSPVLATPDDILTLARVFRDFVYSVGEDQVSVDSTDTVE